MYDRIDSLAVDTIRTLSIDQINRANSGHPGLPMGAAPMAYVLFTRHLKHNPKNSKWFDRDRFVLSAGHGSALLYSMLHLSGYDLSLDDLKNFRKYGSKTPGHPEVHHTDGVEVTTGPLGQGVATAVGMAMAEAHMASIYNKDNLNIVDHYTYVLCGDGDLMEGVSAEASSLAGHLKLGKLIMLYDSNNICLDGPTTTAFTEDVKQRYEAYGWQYLRVEDGNNLEAIDEAILKAKEDDRPSLIEVKTIIGYGAPNAGTNKVHGAPLGEEGAKFAKKSYGWEYSEFFVPEEVKERFKELTIERGEERFSEWESKLKQYSEANKLLYKAFIDAIEGVLPENWYKSLPKYSTSDAAMASRKTSEAAIQKASSEIPFLWGGSADLSSSNNTMIKNADNFEKENYAGRNIFYGVREFAMGAMMNGIALHGGTKTYGGTFFVFSDYLKGAIRLAAISQAPVTYVFTHDSVAVGEDGPTHEPIEHLAAWRAMPNLDVIRPCDGNETSYAWKYAIESKDRPTMLVLTRQNLPVLEGTQELGDEGVKSGAYVLSKAQGEEHGILIATGSEVSLAVEAQKKLAEEGINVRVVSMPSMPRFEAMSKEYKEQVLPSKLRNRLSVEAASTFGWERYVGLDGVALGIDRFGASGDGSLVMKKLGISVDNIVSEYKKAFC